MYSKAWEVLIVDDEPDVLAVSKLAMKNIEVYGSPVHIHTASSKMEAIEVIHRDLILQEGSFSLAVAFVDVVMETDTAGLELVDFLRDELRNYWSQIYIRTGQPGIAPEREVIEKYEINGYFTKVEMTDDKIYSLIQSGVRQFSYLSTAETLSQVSDSLIETQRSREHMQAILNYVASAMEMTAGGADQDTLSFELGIFCGDELIAGREQAAEIKDKLRVQGGVMINEYGDRYIIDGQDFLIHIPESPLTSEFYYATRAVASIPMAEVPLYCRFVRGLSALWQQGS